MPGPKMKCIKGMSTIFLFSLKNYPVTATISLPNFMFDQLQKMKST